MKDYFSNYVNSISKKFSYVNNCEIGLRNFNYSNAGWYFVTICTQNHKHYFGEIKNGKMFLNEFGKIVEEYWNWLSEQYKYCILDEFVIMPNHFHGILIIDPNNIKKIETCYKSDVVVTTFELSLQNQKNQQQECIKLKSLSGLIGAFKTQSSKHIHLLGNPNFKWQRSFYDRIIRNEKELYNIRKYIQQNPVKFDLGKYID